MRSGKTDELIRMAVEVLEQPNQRVVIAVPTKAHEGSRVMRGIHRYLRNGGLVEYARDDKIKLLNGSEAMVYSRPESVRGVAATEVLAHWDTPWLMVHAAVPCEVTHA